jgi:hypothetical protein
MKITLPCFAITIDLGAKDPDHSVAYQGGTITSELHRDGDPPEVQAASPSNVSLRKPRLPHARHPERTVPRKIEIGHEHEKQQIHQKELPRVLRHP